MVFGMRVQIYIWALANCISVRHFGVELQSGILAPRELTAAAHAGYFCSAEHTMS